MAALTNREREIVSLLATGERQTVIARRLCISVRTVEHHVRSAKLKTGEISTFALAVKAAIESSQSPSK